MNQNETVQAFLDAFVNRAWHRFAREALEKLLRQLGGRLHGR
jgi:hypothetical protein